VIGTQITSLDPRKARFVRGVPIGARSQAALEEISRPDGLA
jgi:hypothetical protein